MLISGGPQRHALMKVAIQLRKLSAGHTFSRRLFLLSAPHTCMLDVAEHACVLNGERGINSYWRCLAAAYLPWEQKDRALKLKTPDPSDFGQPCPYVYWMFKTWKIPSNVIPLWPLHPIWSQWTIWSPLDSPYLHSDYGDVIFLWIYAGSIQAVTNVAVWLEIGLS